MNRTKVPNFAESFNRSTTTSALGPIPNPSPVAAALPSALPLPVFIPPTTNLLSPLYHHRLEQPPPPPPNLSVLSRETSVVHAPAAVSDGILGWFKQNYGKVLLCVLLLIVVTILLVRRMTFFKNRQKLKKEQEDEEEDSTDIKDDEWESFFTETSGLNQQNADADADPQPPLPPPPRPTTYGQQHHELLYRPAPAAPFYASHPTGMTPLPPLPPQQPHAAAPPAHTPPQDQGQRGNVQPRFAPPESTNAAAFMPHSMMPESTRPVRELSSDATFTVNTEEIPITMIPEAQEASKKKSDLAAVPET